MRISHLVVTITPADLPYQVEASLRLETREGMNFEVRQTVALPYDDTTTCLDRYIDIAVKQMKHRLYEILAEAR